MILAEIITTGEEVLNGERTDTNARWLSQHLVQLGLKINRRTTVGDRLDDLMKAFKESGRRADVVIVNGGLGPTVDDLSAQAAARAKGERRCLNQQWVRTLEERFRAAGRDMSPNNLKQAELPQSAHIIDNPIGTACGFWIRLDRAILYFTPGVPPEMKRMMREFIMPDIRTRFPLGDPPILKRLHCFGLAEANLDALFSQLSRPDNLNIGFRAHFPTIEVKLSTSATDSPGIIDAFIDALPNTIADYVVARDAGSMESVIAEEMTRLGFTLTLAESCTGGLIAKRIVDMAGSSAFFSASFVTYSNDSKINNLGVDPRLIDENGAVSIDVAEAMARAAREKTGTSHALSISGIAGPGGGTEAKPVGTMGVSLATPQTLVTQLVHLPNFGRRRLRLGGAYLAFDMLRRHLQQLPIFADYSYIKRMATRTTPI